MPTQPKPMVLFDGECGMCRRTITWVANRDRETHFCYHEFQTAPTPPMTPELAKACERAVHVVLPNGAILRGALATLYMLEKTGWGWFARIWTVQPMVWLAHAVYRLIADHRPFWAQFLFRRDYVEGGFTAASLNCD